MQATQKKIKVFKALKYVMNMMQNCGGSKIAL